MATAKFGGNGRKVGNAATDPIGTVRRSPNGLLLGIMWPSRPHPSTWAVTDDKGSLGYEKPERVAHWPVVGAVPFSPAAGVPLDGSVQTSVRAVTTVHLPETAAGGAA